MFTHELWSDRHYQNVFQMSKLNVDIERLKNDALKTLKTKLYPRDIPSRGRFWAKKREFFPSSSVIAKRFPYENKASSDQINGDENEEACFNYGMTKLKKKKSDFQQAINSIEESLGEQGAPYTFTTMREIRCRSFDQPFTPSSDRKFQFDEYRIRELAGHNNTPVSRGKVLIRKDNKSSVQYCNSIMKDCETVLKETEPIFERLHKAKTYSEIRLKVLSSNAIVRVT
eukprot:TRINITY_DN2384_c0_g5_i1.p1 TRINITY_DN2384_c0_g5~~TRINITY_DN2384_c0_g5_i1.p1  ORF type:complete len:228 (-),score=17.55 TRINITY_DN2384_c0_g5_i1:100-783(-)